MKEDEQRDIYLDNVRASKTGLIGKLLEQKPEPLFPALNNISRRYSITSDPRSSLRVFN